MKQARPGRRAGVVSLVFVVGILTSAISARASVAIHDDFSRVVSKSWGSAPGGSSWDYTVTAGSAFALSVDGQKAIASSPSGVNKGNLLVGPSTSDDVDVAGTFTVNMQPKTGSTNNYQLLLRLSATRTYYGMRVLPALDGSAIEDITRAVNGDYPTVAEIPAPFTMTVGSAYRIRARAVTQAGGVVLSMRAWPASAPEPSAWDLSAIDTDPLRLLSGRAGVRMSFYAGPAQMTLDDFSIDTVTSTLPSPSPSVSPSPSPSPSVSPSPSPSPSVSPSPSPSPSPSISVQDPFARTVSGSWGSAPGGWPWSFTLTAGSPFALSVDGAQGIAYSSSGVNKGFLLAGPSTSADADVSAMFTVSAAPASGTPNHVSVILRNAGAQTYYEFKLSMTTTAPPDGLEVMRAVNGVWDTIVEGPAQVPIVIGNAYRIHARVMTISGGVQVFMRAWPVSSPEPATWDLAGTDVDPTRLLSGRAGVRLSFYYTPARITVDDFTYTSLS